jgi:2-aminoethylphosphonate-pyruvate transaminase
VAEVMKKNPDVTNVGVVHCETTTGILNPIQAIGRLTRQLLPHATYFVDAMSSFGGVPFSVAECEIDFLVTSSNKCIQVKLSSPFFT